MRTDDRQGNELLRKKARLALPGEILEGVLEYDDHLVPGGVWYRDRLDYSTGVEVLDAQYRHHRGRRRSAKTREIEYKDDLRKEWFRICSELGIPHKMALSLYRAHGEHMTTPRLSLIRQQRGVRF